MLESCQCIFGRFQAVYLGDFKRYIQEISDSGFGKISRERESVRVLGHFYNYLAGFRNFKEN